MNMDEHGKIYENPWFPVQIFPQTNTLIACSHERREIPLRRSGRGARPGDGSRVYQKKPMV